MCACVCCRKRRRVRGRALEGLPVVAGNAEETQLCLDTVSRHDQEDESKMRMVMVMKKRA